MPPSDGGVSRPVSSSSSPQKKKNRAITPNRWQNVEVWSSTASGWAKATMVALDRRAGSEDIITVEFDVPGVGRCGKRLYATSDRVRGVPLESLEDDDDEEDLHARTNTKTNAATCGVDDEESGEEADKTPGRADRTPDLLEALGKSPQKRRPSSSRPKRVASSAALPLLPPAPEANLQTRGSSISLSGLDTVVLGDKVGSGSFGVVYAGTIEATGQKVAIKFEQQDCKVPQLEDEAEILQALQGAPHVAGLHWYGSEGNYNIMVMDLLGSSLEDVFEGSGRMLSAARVATLAVQMVACVQYLHSKDFLHRDIKPNNFTMGIGHEASQVKIIDFGLGKPFRDIKGLHYPPATGVCFVGTLRYASIRAHLRHEQSRRDDMHSLGYVFAYFLRGRLPWQGIDAPTKEERRAEILRAKKNTPPPLLFDGQPRQFLSYMYKVFELGHFQDPPYEQLRASLRGVVEELGGPTTEARGPGDGRGQAMRGERAACRAFGDWSP